MRSPRAAIPVVLILCLLAAPWAADAQAPQRVFRIGWLAASSRPPDVAPVSLVFARELLALGWVEGQHYVLEYRFADGRAQLPALAAELVALPVDLILAVSSPAAQAAKAATTTVPIVFQIGSNPIQRGLVATLAHPGGNLTGYTDEGIYEEKQLQLLKEAVPRLSRVGVLSRCLESRIGAGAARALGVQIQCVKVEDAKGLPDALKSMARANIGGLIVTEQDWIGLVHYEEIAEFATRNRLPTIGLAPGYTNAGGLLCYGPKPGQADASAAALVDRIRRGAKPADLPILLPTHFTFVINLKTAKAIGLTIPPSVLARADQVIQ